MFFHWNFLCPYNISSSSLFNSFVNTNCEENSPTIIWIGKISVFRYRKILKNSMKMFLCLSQEDQLSSPSVLLTKYGINYCQTKLYVSAWVPHCFIFQVSCFLCFLFMPTFQLYWWKLSSLFKECNAYKNTIWDQFSSAFGILYQFWFIIFIQRCLQYIVTS